MTNYLTNAEVDKLVDLATRLRIAMTTPPKGHTDDEHGGYWWTVEVEKVCEAIAELVAP